MRVNARNAHQLRFFKWKPPFFILDSDSTENLMKNSYPNRFFSLRPTGTTCAQSDQGRKSTLFQTPCVAHVLTLFFDAELRGDISF